MVLITGADGLLGATLARELLARGESVRAMVEPGAAARTLQGLDVERIEVDLSASDPPLAEATAGCDVVFHVAAITSPWASEALTWAVNLGGTRKLLDAAAASGVRRVVAVSTANTLAPRGPNSSGDETGRFPELYRPLAYARSKRDAARLVLNRAARGDLETVVIAPTFMLGEHVAHLSSAQLVIEAVRRQPPLVPPGGKNVVHVRDVARALIAAAERGRSGQLYLAGHRDVSYRELLTIIARVAGHRPPRGTLPAAVVKTAGMVGSAMRRVRPVRLTRAEARIACANAWYDVSRADRELGLEHTPIEEAVSDCLTGLRRYGHL